MPGLQDPRSLGGLLSELLREVSTLVRQEFELARTEAGEKVGQITIGMVTFLGGAICTFAGLLVLTDALVVALSEPPIDLNAAVSALIVGGVMAVLSVIFLMMGRNSLRMKNLDPSRTRASLQRDRDLIERRLR